MNLTNHPSPVGTLGNTITDEERLLGMGMGTTTKTQIQSASSPDHHHHQRPNPQASSTVPGRPVEGAIQVQKVVYQTSSARPNRSGW